MPSPPISVRSAKAAHVEDNTRAGPSPQPNAARTSTATAPRAPRTALGFLRFQPRRGRKQDTVTVRAGEDLLVLPDVRDQLGLERQSASLAGAVLERRDREPLAGRSEVFVRLAVAGREAVGKRLRLGRHPLALGLHRLLLGLRARPLRVEGPAPGRQMLVLFPDRLLDRLGPVHQF